MWLAFVDIVIAMTRDDSVARVDWRVVDAVDEEWASERLPDDGARRARAKHVEARRSRTRGFVGWMLVFLIFHV